GCGTTAAACGCGCGCGCGTTTAACGCGACGCGASYACTGQMFCAMHLTKNTSSNVPVSLSQCNLYSSSTGQSVPKISIDQKQDLKDYSLTFENGRMKASAKRSFNTGDSTDYVLQMDKAYYILLVVGSGTSPPIQVGYHGASSSSTLICVSTLSEKGECKPPAEWDDEAPQMQIVSSSSFAMQSPFWALLLASLMAVN
ncbi:unnamed protein product, partial [Durusdinium trenchii]